ncbi:MAG: SGNH/GDSL hydrolase family protein [Pirellulaceae bacterium]|nr:SGNH/GDSL hydrolase family protein [Pirellulaceae bacterium]
MTLATPGVDPPAALGHAAGQSLATPSASSRWMMVALQLLLAVLIVRMFEIEERRQLFTMLAIAIAGFPIYFQLPYQWRSWFFVFLTGLTSGLILGWAQTALAFAVGSSLVGLCYLPLAYWWRIGLLLAAGVLLAILRSGSSSLFWPVVGSMFMFRLILFVSDTRSQPKMPPLQESLPYFFLIPNVCFVLFPVVDFSTYQQTRQAKLSTEDCQQGVNWIVLGITHLLVYRAIRYWILPPPGSIENINTLLLFLVTNYGLYLRVAGQFHLAIGVLHLYGYRLPRTHDWFFFASGFTDIWRRINIYWKDFMSKMFFMPAFFRLRRYCGDPIAVCLAVMWVFFGTWIAHSWQVFWLLGEFPLSLMDAQLWLGAGVFVAANALLDYRHARHPDRGSKAYSLSAGAYRVLRTMGTFLLVSFFWARWTNPDLLVNLQKEIGLAYFLDAKQWTLCLALLAGVFAAGLALHFYLFQRSRGPQSKTGPVLRNRSGLNIAWLGALFLFAQPTLVQNVPIEWAHLMLAMQSDHFSQTEASQMVQGYYEELNEGSIQAGLFSGHGAALRDDTERRHFMDFTRSRRDILQIELIPNFKAEYHGAMISINRWNMRNHDIEKTKQPGTLRIALLGSSVVMGYGVGDEETFAVQLEKQLNSDKYFTDLNPRYEVLNFGVGKYSPLRRRALLEKKVLEFDPDVVLYIAHQDEIYSAVFDMAKFADLGLIDDDPCLLNILTEAGVDATTPSGVIRNRLPNHALEILSCTYNRIITFCNAHSLVPIWVDLPIPGQFEIPGTPEMARGLAQQAGFQILDLADWADDYETAEVMLYADIHHASVKGHKVIAQRLLEELRRHSSLLKQK